MSRIRLVAGVIVVAAAAAGLAAAPGCGDDPQPAPPPPAPAGTPDLEDLKARRAEVEKLTEAQRAEADKHARGLLASCDSRIYRPARDARVRRATGRIDVKSGGKEATYRFTYDVANPEDKPVAFETVSEPGGWDPAIAADVRRWGLIACLSAYEVVAYYRPPLQMSLVPSTDGNYRVVVAPPAVTPLSVSYSVNAQDVINARGEWTDDTHKFVTQYDWQQVQNRWFLRGAKIVGGTSSRFEYDHREELVLLRTIHVDGGAAPVDAQITFESIERPPK